MICDERSWVVVLDPGLFVPQQAVQERLRPLNAIPFDRSIAGGPPFGIRRPLGSHLPRCKNGLNPSRQGSSFRHFLIGVVEIVVDDVCNTVRPELGILREDSGPVAPSLG